MVDLKERMTSAMKSLNIVFLSAALGLLSAQGQPGGGSRPGMGSAQASPGLNPSTAKLFGENNAFSAQLEMQTGGQGPDAMTMPGKIFFDHGKSRFEIDLSRIKGGMMSPEAAIQMKSIGMDQTIVISRPDKKTAYQVYPGMQAYVETPLTDKDSDTSVSDLKMDLTELGKETIDGHPCTKNKAVVTDKDGAHHESIVWNATDLKKFPLKIEQGEGDVKLTMLFREVSLSKPEASLFDPPAKATKYDNMQSMMQQEIMKRMGGLGGSPAQVK